MTAAIESDIPLPGRSKYPFKQMKVGESFFATAQHNNFYSAARQAGIKIAVRKETKNGTVGRRVWRVA